MEDGIEPGRNRMDWNRQMRDLGHDVRRVRRFLGLSQEQLAQMAGVSQGAVSRLEAGRGLATPLHVVVRIYRVLRTGLASVEPSTVSDDLSGAVGAERFFALTDDMTVAVTPIVTDSQLETLFGQYRRLPPEKRSTFLKIVSAALGALS
jgi:transcriptional regulator with XRE-family HTH domain